MLTDNIDLNRSKNARPCLNPITDEIPYDDWDVDYMHNLCDSVVTDAFNSYFQKSKNHTRITLKELIYFLKGHIMVDGCHFERDYLLRLLNERVK